MYYRTPKISLLIYKEMYFNTVFRFWILSYSTISQNFQEELNCFGSFFQLWMDLDSLIAKMEILNVAFSSVAL